jgi:hypothetical protein
LSLYESLGDWILVINNKSNSKQNNCDSINLAKQLDENNKERHQN